MADIPEPDLDLAAMQNAAAANPGLTPQQPPQQPAPQSREVVAPLRSFTPSAAPPPSMPIARSAGYSQPAPAAPPLQQPQAYAASTVRSTPANTQNVNNPAVLVETIEIAPHPTTNRFPWAPIENPKVPIYQPSPAADLTPPPAPQPVQPPDPPQPVYTPAPIQPLSPQPEPSPPVQQEPAYAPAPMPAPPPAPQPSPPQELASVVSPPPPPPPPAPHRRTGRPVRHIYSDYTREVWHAFRPSRLLRFMLAASVLLFVGFLIAIWMMNGSPTNIMDLPFLQRILQAE